MMETLLVVEPNESAGGQAAVFGRGSKCCAGHKTVTLVVLWLSSAVNGVILWARSRFLNDEVC